MADQPGGIDLTRRDSFKLFTPVTIRFCDTDLLGHVNNVAISSYFEAGRCELFYNLLQRVKEPELDFILARIAIDFRREIKYPGTVEIGSRFTRIGTKSLASGFGCFIGDECLATAECVNVFFHPVKRQTFPPTAALREAIEAEIAG